MDNHNCSLDNLSNKRKYLTVSTKFVCHSISFRLQSTRFAETDKCARGAQIPLVERRLTELPGYQATIRVTASYPPSTATRQLITVSREALGQQRLFSTLVMCSISLAVKSTVTILMTIPVSTFETSAFLLRIMQINNPVMYTCIVLCFCLCTRVCDKIDWNDPRWLYVDKIQFSKLRALQIQSVKLKRIFVIAQNSKKNKSIYLLARRRTRNFRCLKTQDRTLAERRRQRFTKRHYTQDYCAERRKKLYNCTKFSQSTR